MLEDIVQTYLGLFVEARLSSGNIVEGAFTDYEHGLLYIGGEPYSIDDVTELYGLGDVVHFNATNKLGYFGMKDMESVSFKADERFFEENPDLTEEDLFYGEYDLRFRFGINKYSVGKRNRWSWSPRLVYKRRKLFTHPYSKHAFLYVFPETTIFGILDRYDEDNFCLAGDETPYSRYELISVLSLPTAGDKVELHARDEKVSKGIVTLVDNEKKIVTIHDGTQVSFDDIVRIVRFGYLPQDKVKLMVLPEESSRASISIYRASVSPSFPSARGEVSFETYADSTMQVLWNAKNVVPAEEAQEYGRVEELDNDGGTVVSMRGQFVEKRFHFLNNQVKFGKAFVGARALFCTKAGIVKTAHELYILSASAPEPDVAPPALNQDANPDSIKMAESFVEGETIFIRREAGTKTSTTAGTFVSFDAGTSSLIYHTLDNGQEQTLALKPGISLWRCGRITTVDFVRSIGIIENKFTFNFASIEAGELRHLLTQLRESNIVCIYSFKGTRVRVSLPGREGESYLPWKEGVISGPFHDNVFLIDNRVIGNLARYTYSPVLREQVLKNGVFVGLGHRIFYRSVTRFQLGRGLVEEALCATYPFTRGQFIDPKTFERSPTRWDYFASVSPKVSTKIGENKLVYTPLYAELVIDEENPLGLSIVGTLPVDEELPLPPSRFLFGYIQDYDPNSKTLFLNMEFAGHESRFSAPLDAVITDLQDGEIHPENHLRVVALLGHLESNPQIEEVYLSAERGFKVNGSFADLIEEEERHSLLDDEDSKRRASALFYQTEQDFAAFCEKKGVSAEECAKEALTALDINDGGKPKATFDQRRRLFQEAMYNLALFFDAKSSADILQRMRDFRDELRKEQWLRPGVLLQEDYEVIAAIRDGCDLVRDGANQHLMQLKNAIFRFSSGVGAKSNFEFLSDTISGLAKNLVSFFNEKYLPSITPKLLVAWANAHRDGAIVSVHNAGGMEARNVEMVIPISRNAANPVVASFEVSGQVEHIHPGKDAEFFIDFHGEVPPAKLAVDIEYLTIGSIDYKGNESLQTNHVKDEFRLEDPNVAFEPIKVNRYDDIGNLNGIDATDQNEDMFFGRDKFIEQLIAANLNSNGELVRGRCTAIWGQRRCGKTSVAGFLRKRIKERFPETITLYYDLDNADSLEGLENGLFTLILDQVDANKELRKLFAKEEINCHAPDMTFERFARLTSLNEMFKNYKIVLTLDEFTSIIGKIRSGIMRKDFIIQLLAMCQRCGVICYFFGHDEITHFWDDTSFLGGDEGVRTMNALSKVPRFQMTFLAFEDAETMMERPLLCTDGRSRFLPENKEETVEYIFALTGGSPFYLMLVMRALTNYMMWNHITAVYRRLVEDMVRDYIFYSHSNTAVDVVHEIEFHPLWLTVDANDVKKNEEIVKSVAYFQKLTPNSGALIGDVVGNVKGDEEYVLSLIRRLLRTRSLFYSEQGARFSGNEDVMVEINDSALKRRYVKVSVELYCEYLYEKTGMFDTYDY